MIIQNREKNTNKNFTYDISKSTIICVENVNQYIELGAVLIVKL